MMTVVMVETHACCCMWMRAFLMRALHLSGLGVSSAPSTGSVTAHDSASVAPSRRSDDKKRDRREKEERRAKEERREKEERRSSRHNKHSTRDEQRSTRSSKHSRRHGECCFYFPVTNPWSRQRSRTRTRNVETQLSAHA